MDTSRIRKLAKNQGKSVTYLCKLLDRPKYYLNDVDKSDNVMPEKYLKILAINLGTTVEYLMGETDDPGFHLTSVGLTPLEYEKSGTRPVFGHASAGLGVYAEQEILGQEPVEPQYDNDDFFWLRVSGDSMSPVFMDGDLVLIHRDVPVESGTIMVVTVDDTDGFIKKVSVNDDTVTLSSFNPYYPPKVFGGSELNRLRFFGRVVEQKRKF